MPKLKRSPLASEVINLAASLQKDDPKKLAIFLGQIWGHVDEDMHGDLLALAHEVREEALDQGDYALAYQYHTIESDKDDTFLEEIKQCALDQGDHEAAYDYHVKQYDLRYNEEEGSVLLHESYEDVIEWFSKARACAIGQDDFRDACFYTFLQYSLYDVGSPEMEATILSYETIAEAAVIAQDYESASYAMEKLCGAYSEHMDRFGDDREEEVTAKFDAICNRADEIDKLSETVTLSDIVERFKHSFLPAGYTPIPANKLKNE